MSGTPDQKPPNSNPTSALLELAKGGDKWVQMVTIGLVLLSGGGNFFGTMQVGRQERDDIQKALREVHDVHQVLDSSIARQKQMDGNIQKILDKQK